MQYAYMQLARAYTASCMRTPRTYSIHRLLNPAHYSISLHFACGIVSCLKNPNSSSSAILPIWAFGSGINALQSYRNMELAEDYNIDWTQPKLGLVLEFDKS